jgi:hypothetical protein
MSLTLNTDWKYIGMRGTWMKSALLTFVISISWIGQVFSQEKIPTIYFENFSVNIEAGNLKSKPLNFNSNPNAIAFRTKITEAYLQKGNNFAGHFKIALFGCGGSCIMGFAIDRRTGYIYDLPLGEKGSCLFAAARALYQAQSNLFIAGVCKESPESDTFSYAAFLFEPDEKHKGKWRFKPVAAKNFLIKRSSTSLKRK